MKASRAQPPVNLDAVAVLSIENREHRKVQGSLEHLASKHAENLGAPGNRGGTGDDYQVVRCEIAREILSAELDGEAMPLEISAARTHARPCSGCTTWTERAVVVTRVARISIAENIPDLAARILGADASR